MKKNSKKFRNLVPLDIKSHLILRVERRVNGEPCNWYFNLLTGKGSYNLDDVVEKDIPYQLLENRKVQRLYGCKIQWDEKNQVVAFIMCSIDASSPCTSNEKRDWIEYGRVMVDKEKNIWQYYDWSRIWYCHEPIKMSYVGKEFSIETATEISKASDYKKVILLDSTKVLTDELGAHMWYAADEMAPIRKLFGKNIVPIAGNKMVALDNLSALASYLSYQQPTSGRQSEKLKKMLSYNLPDVQLDTDILNPLSPYYGWIMRYNIAAGENLQKIAVIQRVEEADEPTCVIRSFFISPELKDYCEGGRIYITKKEIISSKKLENGEYMSQSLLDKPVHWKFLIKEIDPEVTKGTYLEYFGEIMNEIEPEYRGLAIWSFLRYPITERLYKTPVIKSLIKNMFHMCAFETPIEVLSRIFGKIHVEEKKVDKFLGFNKYQLELLAPLAQDYLPKTNLYRWIQDRNTPFSCFKRILSNDCASYDNNTSDWAYEVIETLFSTFRQKSSEAVVSVRLDYREYSRNNYHGPTATIPSILRKLIQTYGLETAKAMSSRLIQDCEKTVEYTNAYEYRMYQFNHRVHTEGKVIIVFEDYVDMVVRMGAQSRFKPYYDTLEQLSAMHDMMVSLINTNRDTLKINNWNKQKDKWNKYLYEGEKFIVLVPQTPEDLATEGITLHHCVKSYIPKVAEGMTNIAFIRKKEEPNVPFFTVEIDNTNCIQQVHGSCNRNADTEEGLVEFIKEWSKKKNLHLDTYNKVR